MIILKNLPLPHRYRRSCGGAAAVAAAAASPWTSLLHYQIDHNIEKSSFPLLNVEILEYK
jgi:hypothetical protein